MKIAFLILTHHYPERLTALVQALDDPRFDFFIHADARGTLGGLSAEDFSLRDSRVHVLPRPRKVYWGDISMVDATLDLYRYALAHGDYGRFVLLSGEDYPIQSNDTIYSHLSRSDVEYITGRKLTNLAQVKEFHFWKLRNRLLVRCIRKGLYILGIRKKPYLTVNGNKWDVYVASQWVALTRKATEYIVSTADSHPEIRRYFRFAHAPDQLFTPTILYNSPAFCDKTVVDPESCRSFNGRATLHYLRYAPQRGSSVTYFDESDYADMLASGKLFFRKARSGKSDKLLAMLDAYRQT